MEAAVEVEERIRAGGEEEGREKGQEEGCREGYHTGKVAGQEIGRKVGFVAGCVAALDWLGSQGKLTKRSAASVSALEAMIKEARLFDTDDERLTEKVELMWTNLAMLASTLGVNLKSAEELNNPVQSIDW